MLAIVNRFVGLLLLVAVAATPLACVNVNRDRQHEEPKKNVSIGGKYGVNVNRSDPGTEVKVGGDHGVVVGHPHDGEDR